jgi:hypothetical protein
VLLRQLPIAEHNVLEFGTPARPYPEDNDVPTVPDTRLTPADVEAILKPVHL